MPPESQVLDAELLAAIVRALRREWDLINYGHFRSALKAPLLLLSDAESRLGRWDPQTRTIEISKKLVLSKPWGVVVEVLKHEMAHQYVHEVLKATSETAHGEAFRTTCERMGIDAAAAGMPEPSPLSEDESRVPRRIAKLLALAESSNRHEAEAAMREAQRLMLKYNVDAAASTPDARRHYSFRHLGAPTGRLQPHLRHLGAIIGEFFFVEAIWVTVHRPLLGQSGTVLEVCGSEANLAMAAYVYDFLLQAADRLWETHKREHRVTGDRDRRSFLTGVMRGFYEKLKEQEKQNRSEGLIWLGDKGLESYYDQRHPRRRTVYSRARAAPQAYAHGKAAGREIVLHKPVGGKSGGGGAGGRLLPGRRD